MSHTISLHDELGAKQFDMVSKILNQLTEIPSTFYKLQILNIHQDKPHSSNFTILRKIKFLIQESLK